MEKLCFLIQIFQNRKNFFYLEPTLYQSVTKIVLSHEHAHLRETQSNRNFGRSQCVSKKAKSWDSPRKWKIGSCTLWYGHGTHFRKQYWHGIWSDIEKKKNLKNQNLFSTRPAYSLPWYTQTRLKTKLLMTRKPLAELFVFISKLKAGDIKTTGQ